MPLHRAEVTAAWDEGPLMCGVRLADAPAYRAGQALRVQAAGTSALFAFARAHGHGRAPELLLRRGGVVADALIATLSPGSTLTFEAPVGPGFPIEPARGRDVLLVAAGSGISAIRAALEALLDERAAYGRLALYYGQEEEQHFAYAAARRAWQEAGVEVVLCARTPSPGWRGERGVVQDVLAARTPGIDPTHAIAYLCGMSEMIVAVRAALAGLGLAPERTYLNY